MVDPKLLSLPQDTFAGLSSVPYATSRKGSRKGEGRDGWRDADGEASGSEPDAYMTDEEDGDDCWIEGRFQG